MIRLAAALDPVNEWGSAESTFIGIERRIVLCRMSIQTMAVRLRSEDLLREKRSRCSSSLVR